MVQNAKELNKELENTALNFKPKQLGTTLQR